MKQGNNRFIDSADMPITDSPQGQPLVLPHTTPYLSGIYAWKTLEEAFNEGLLLQFGIKTIAELKLLVRPDRLTQNLNLLKEKITKENFSEEYEHIAGESLNPVDLSTNLNPDALMIGDGYLYDVETLVTLGHLISPVTRQAIIPELTSQHPLLVILEKNLTTNKPIDLDDLFSDFKIPIPETKAIDTSIDTKKAQRLLALMAKDQNVKMCIQISIFALAGLLLRLGNRNYFNYLDTIHTETPGCWALTYPVARSFSLLTISTENMMKVTQFFSSNSQSYPISIHCISAGMMAISAMSVFWEHEFNTESLYPLFIPTLNMSTGLIALCHKTAALPQKSWQCNLATLGTVIYAGLKINYLNQNASFTDNLILTASETPWHWLLFMYLFQQSDDIASSRILSPSLLIKIAFCLLIAYSPEIDYPTYLITASSLMLPFCITEISAMRKERQEPNNSPLRSYSLFRTSDEKLALKEETNNPEYQIKQR